MPRRSEVDIALRKALKSEDGEGRERFPAELGGMSASMSFRRRGGDLRASSLLVGDGTGDDAEGASTSGSRSMSAIDLFTD